MHLSELTSNVAHWLSGEDDADGMVISCRARLARNLRTRPFAQKATEEDQEYVIEQVLTAAQRSRHLHNAVFLKMNALNSDQRRFLVERHLISPALADSKGLRGVLYNRDESLSVMVNEEDHLRLQAILPGMQALQAWSRIDAVDDELGAGLDYAHSEKWGYLTACLTNTGTGLRASVLIHLPALVLTEDMERVIRGLAHMSFAVRGVYGEGTHASGNLFQISNQVTLGLPEEAIVRELARLTRQLIDYERDAQETLMGAARSQVEDKIWRAYGVLSHARVLSSQELMNLLSALRLGHSLGLVRNVPSSFMNRLMIVTQPSHLHAEAGRILKPEERDVRRAALVRLLLGKLRSKGNGGTG